MNVYETDIMSLLNEHEKLMGTNNVILEVKIPKLNLPEEVTVLDKARYKELLKKSNEIITGVGGKAQSEDIINVILDLLKMCIKWLTRFSTKTVARMVVPDALKIKFIFKDFEGKPFMRALNPIGFVLDCIVSRLVTKLYEISVSPIRVKYYVKSYNEMVENLQRIKQLCSDDPDICNKCDIQIKRINNCINSLESKIFKEEYNMRTVGETMFNIDNSAHNVIVTESDLYDSMCEAEAMFLGDDEFINPNIIVDEGKRCTRCENADEDDDIDDIDDDIDESSLFGFDDDIDESSFNFDDDIF